MDYKKILVVFLRDKGFSFSSDLPAVEIISRLNEYLNKKNTTITTKEARHAIRVYVCANILVKKKAVRKSQKKWDKFFSSPAWRELRYKVLQRHGRVCQCCFAKGSTDKPLHVDHIKPRSKFPELELEESNLQVLCKDCNLGKSNKDDTDFREGKANPSQWNERDVYFHYNLLKLDCSMKLSDKQIRKLVDNRFRAKSGDFIRSLGINLDSKSIKQIVRALNPDGVPKKIKVENLKRNVGAMMFYRKRG